MISGVYQHNVETNEVHHYRLSEELQKRTIEQRNLKKRTDFPNYPGAASYNWTGFTTANTTSGLISRARAMAQFLSASYPYDHEEEKDAVHSQSDAQIASANFSSTNLFEGIRESMDDMQTNGVQLVVL